MCAGQKKFFTVRVLVNSQQKGLLYLVRKFSLKLCNKK